MRAVVLATFLCLLSSTVAAKETLEIATAAPSFSAWGKVFAAWARAVERKTGGSLAIRFHWRGVQGGDATVVGKLKSGQLDGATLGARGLGMIHQPALALQLPGLFRSWDAIDHASKTLYPRLAKGFADQGLYLSSIGTVGRAHTFTKGHHVRSVADLRRMKPFAPPTSAIFDTMASQAGLTPVKIPISQLLPALSSGRVDVMTAPPLVVEQLQFAPHLNFMNEDVVAVAVGAMVFRQSSLDTLPEDAKRVLRGTGRRAGQLIRDRVRRMDGEAYARLAKRLTVVSLSDTQRKEWTNLFTEVRRRLGQGTFSPALIAEVERLARERRSTGD
ncbi:MAG: TRAP transporter substrate-binding protein DctP [Myxococcota bacterium]